MTLVLEYPPLPGTWVRRAQDCLDTLSTMTTLDEVVATYGSARAIVTEVLGTPAAGGAGTRRTVRATGALLTHRLSPALAVEALSWAASVAEDVDPASIEAFLEEAATSKVVHRPVRVEDRDVLLSHLADCRTEAARRATLRRLWETWTHNVQNMPRSPSDEGLLAEAPRGSYLDDDEPTIEEWLSSLGGADDRALPEPPPRPKVFDVYNAATDEEQLVAFDRLDDTQREPIAKCESLFGLADQIISRSLDEFPDLVLANSGCPDELRSRVRHPYDPATLELALRAGHEHFEVARMRRLLGDLDAKAHAQYVSRMPRHYLQALRVCGLNTAEALLRGRLSDVDLTNSEHAEAILGTANVWKWRRMPANVADVLISHRQAASLTWIFEARGYVILLPEIARRLVDEACPEVADRALRYLTGADLSEVDVRTARRNGDFWIARCQGIAAVDRPRRTLWSAQEEQLRNNHWYDDDDDLTEWSPRHAHQPFSYPAEVEALKRPYPEAPGWAVALPETPHELRRNAGLMRNCTSSFVTDVRKHRSFIAIVWDPEGRRYNVAIWRDGSTYRVGQINSWANRGIRPAWIRPAFEARLAEPLAFVELADPPTRGRRPAPRQNRRRASTGRRRR